MSSNCTIRLCNTVCCWSLSKEKWWSRRRPSAWLFWIRKEIRLHLLVTRILALWRIWLEKRPMSRSLSWGRGNRTNRRLWPRRSRRKEVLTKLKKRSSPGTQPLNTSKNFKSRLKLKKLRTKLKRGTLLFKWSKKWWLKKKRKLKWKRKRRRSWLKNKRS